MRQTRYSRTKDEGGEESVFESKHKVLLNNNQWSYLINHYRLTNRELQVGKLVCQGYTNKEIAKILTMKFGTVKTHLLNIFRKAHVTSKIELLLTFADDVSKSSVKPVVDPTIPIIDIIKTNQKTAGLDQNPQKE